MNATNAHKSPHNTSAATQRAPRGAAAVADILLRLVVAAILLQTLFFKFTGAQESIDIFSRLGIEPWGRYGSGVAELIVAILLLWPATVRWGALGAVAVISGAIISHLTKLGIIVNDDGGLLFALALTVWTGGVIILWLRRAEWPWLAG